MNNSKVRIPKEIAPDVFALAAQLYAQENQDYSLEEIMQAGAEVQIPPEVIQQAIQQIQAKQIRSRDRQRKLKLILTSGGIGVAIALFGFWTYNTVVSNATPSGRSLEANLPSANLTNANPLDIPPAPPPELPPTAGTTFTGEVKQYLLNPEGKVDGLLLNNGLQVKFPPQMADSLVRIITPNTKVSIFGDPGFSTRFGQEVRAKSITNSQTGQTLVEQPPTTAPQPPSLSNYSTLSAQGTAQNWLVGHRGEINGVIISNGTIVKFPPHVGEQLTSMANIKNTIQANGFGTRNRYGQILEATALSVNGQSVSLQPKAIIEP
ncbi:hypothetical protein [Nostoc sp. ChiSLP03a]|uniref:hypothetical protein n=1 Tax=Nostoc sp. ChiSLP03a TaxID=3075380 RepID=UPI002AD4D864|nr:hypothetical protein [Nostoc sp. ChiSLP03a]MDZ8211643.1 hypothetical protein [Nostoc sp. ChiSLP03a]